MTDKSTNCPTINHLLDRSLSTDPAGDSLWWSEVGSWPPQLSTTYVGCERSSSSWCCCRESRWSTRSRNCITSFCFWTAIFTLVQLANWRQANLCAQGHTWFLNWVLTNSSKWNSPSCTDPVNSLFH